MWRPVIAPLACLGVGLIEAWSGEGGEELHGDAAGVGDVRQVGRDPGHDRQPRGRGVHAIGEGWAAKDNNKGWDRALLPYRY